MLEAISLVVLVGDAAEPPEGEYKYIVYVDTEDYLDAMNDTSPLVRMQNFTNYSPWHVQTLVLARYVPATAIDPASVFKNADIVREQLVS